MLLCFGEQQKSTFSNQCTHTHAPMHFICVYTKISYLCVEYYSLNVLVIVMLLVVLAAEISGFLDQDIDMEVPTNINGKDFPAEPLNSVLTHPR